MRGSVESPSADSVNRAGTRVRERTARAVNQDLGEETPRVRKRRAPIPADEIVSTAIPRKEREFIMVDSRASTSKLTPKEPAPPKQKLSLKLRMPEYDRDYENTPTYHSVSKRPNAASRFHGTSCHHCKARTPNIVRCEIKACHAIWCERCINTRYRDPFAPLVSAPSTMPLCPCCQDICQCARCRRVRVGQDPRTSDATRLKFIHEPKGYRPPRETRPVQPQPIVFQRSNGSPDEFESVDAITARVERERRARKRPDLDDSASALTPNLSEGRGSRSVSSSLASSSEDDSEDDLETVKVVVTPRLSRASSVVWSAGPERKRMKRDKPPRRRVDSYDNVSFGDVSLEDALETLHALNEAGLACPSPLPSYLHVDLSPPPSDDYSLPPEPIEMPTNLGVSNLSAPRSVERFSVSPIPFDPIPLVLEKMSEPAPEAVQSTTPIHSPSIAPDWLTSPTSKPVDLPVARGGLDIFGSTVRRLLVAGSSILGLSLGPSSLYPPTTIVDEPISVPTYDTTIPTSPGLLTPDSLDDNNPFCAVIETTTTTMVRTRIESTVYSPVDDVEFSLQSEMISASLVEKIDDGLDVGDWSSLPIRNSSEDWQGLSQSEENSREIY